ncbi:MAG: type II toxin-antitoxin system VapC family toxin [Pyrinomonadaceae bacterium]
MKYLLDTHVLIWTLTDVKKIPTKTRALLEDQRHELFVSAVTFWEIAIKIRSGRLEPIGRWDNAISHVNNLGFQTIPLLPGEAASSKELKEDTHFDPFDRMLIWQAIQRNLILISRDSQFERFASDGLNLFWK